ncbi:hypothetical protein BDQ17DRAFT_1373884 [Cyathus striatus]|nr:hypothetical protein BDQ17DRAFT_1373884 [Cyathus striatus]
MSATEAPMLLTQICSSWRRIALSTPRIWSSIHIVLPNIIRGAYPVRNYLVEEEELVLQTLDRRQAFVKKWLDRSGACPLTISILQTPDAGAFSSNNNAETEAYYNTKQKIRQIHRQFFHDTIIPYHQRWYNLKISFFVDTLQGLLEIGLKTEYLKMLKELHINCQVLHSSDLSTYIYSVPLHAGWGRLTELNLYLDQDPFINAIRLTLKLGISFIGLYDNSISESGDNITLHHLTALSLSVPATNGNHKITAIHPWKLSFPSWPQSDPTSRFQNIINDDLLHALTPVEKEYSNIICPQLEELECDTNILTGITESSLKNLITSLSQKLTLGTDSAIFFRKPGRVFNSYFGGFEEHPSPGYLLPTEVYTII